MLLNESVVAVFGAFQEVDLALSRLAGAGVTTARLSIVGRGFQSTEHVSGFLNADGKIRFWGKLGGFWDRLWAFFGGGLSLTLPGLGHIMVVGPLAAVIASSVEGGIFPGRLNPLGAALYSCGIPRESVAKYEQAVKADGFIIVVRGTLEELTRVQLLLEKSNPSHVDLHDGQTLDFFGIPYGVKPAAVIGA
jgi:hypothetical protein